MTPPSPYGPDRSLPIAVALLVGGGLFAAATVYLLTTSAETFTGQYQAGLTEGQAQQHARSPAPRSVRRSAPAARAVTPGGGLGGVPFAAPAPGRVPAWAGSETSLPPPQPPVRGTYDPRPDMSHADLGPPPDGPGLGMAGAGTGRVGGEPPPGDLPESGGAPLTADLGSGSSNEGASWRSGASRLGNRARALSGALAHLDRSRSSAGERTRTDGASNSTSGDASTAAANRGVRATANPPDPPPDPEQVPVDGGLGWLAAAGAAYAANRLRKQQGASEVDDEA